MRRQSTSSNFRRAIILTEACVSLVLVGLVLAVASLLLTRHADATEYFVNYRRAQLASESYVERMRIGAMEIADTKFVDDSGIIIEIHMADAEEPWRPLRRVNVTATVLGKNDRRARYLLSTYVAPLGRGDP